MSKVTEHVQRLSENAPAMGAAVQDMLEQTANKRGVHFVLIFAVDGVTQYISNVDRPSGTNIMRELLERWEAGAVDVPAHLNPALKGFN